MYPWFFPLMLLRSHCGRFRNIGAVTLVTYLKLKTLLRRGLTGAEDCQEQGSKQGSEEEDERTTRLKDPRKKMDEASQEVHENSVNPCASAWTKD